MIKTLSEEIVNRYFKYRFMWLFKITLLLGACSAAKQDRPNVLFIMSDDHSSQAISAYGGILAKVSQTPNIDRLANEGMRFANCFVTNSICTPSRAAIMTGRYAHKNGVYKFTALDQTQPTLINAMKTGGYETAFIGKYHLHSNPVGLDFYSLLPGQGEYHDPEFVEVGDIHESGWLNQGKTTQFSGHSSDIIGKKTISYLKGRKNQDKPFILFTHFKAPHDTWDYASRYEDHLSETLIPEPDNLFDNYEGRSNALKSQLQFIGSDWGHHTDFVNETEGLEDKDKKSMQYQLYMKKYLRCVKGVDDNVGRILEYLDESGLAENTIVIYTSDQGFFLGEHGLYDKRFMYEEALRMPLMVRWPGKVKPGTISEKMILNIDFSSTILEAAALNDLVGAQGRSFLPILTGGKVSDWRKSMYYRYYYSHFQTEPHYGIRTERHKLIYFDRIDQWELYDLKKDANEMRNMVGFKESEAVFESLKIELEELQIELEDNPENDGGNPNIGRLHPAPLYTSDTINISSDNTLKFRFKTKVGGTLFSTCAIKDVPWTEGFNYDGFKTLSFKRNQLTFFNEFDEDYPAQFDIDLTDGKEHVLHFIVKDSKPIIYVNGILLLKSTRKISGKNPKHTFNVGAGIDWNGELGFNFLGEIIEVIQYDYALTDQEVREVENEKGQYRRLI